MDRQDRPVALVTGAGRSLGRAIAERLHANGYAVAVTDRDLDLASAGRTSPRRGRQLRQRLPPRR